MQTLNVKQLIDEGALTRFHIRVFLCCIISLTFEGYDLVAFGATIPLLLSEWNMSPAYAGVIASYGFGAAVIGAIIGGALGDKWGRKNTIITSVIIFSLGTLACALSKDPTTFAFFRTLTGIGMGMTLQNEVGLVSEYFPNKYRQTAVAGVATGMQLGGIMSAFAAMWLMIPYGWPSVYYLGALPILLVPVLLKYMPEAPWLLVAKKRQTDLEAVLKKLRPDVKVTPEDTFEYPKAFDKSSLAKVFADNRALSAILFWIVYFMNIFVIWGTNTWIPKLMMDAGHGLGASLWIYMSMYLGALVASPIFGQFADRFGAKKVSVFAYFIGFISILQLSMPMDIAATMAVVAIAGACNAGAQNLTHAYVAQFFSPNVKSTMMGWGLSIGRIGGLLGPVVGGVLLSMKVSLFQSFLAFATPCLCSALAIYFVQDQYSYMNETEAQVELAAEPTVNKGL
ncbi:MAG: pcaK 1 [Firmicutes bacterium]|nr:pcaK 1 [Bacillota bacterium]